MTVLVFSMLVLRPDGVLCWVLERVVAPCGFGYVLAACMPVGIGSVPLLLLQQDAGEPIPLPDPALLSCTSMYLLVFIQRVQPGLLVFLWEFEEWQVWWLSHFLKGRMVWEPEQSSQPSIRLWWEPRGLSFLRSPSLPPLGDACIGLSNFPSSASTVSLFWEKLLSCSNNIVAAATG